MTIAAGFEFDEGVLLCADTKITAAMQAKESKLIYWTYGNDCRTVFAFSAGDIAYAKSAIEYCSDAIVKLNVATVSINDIRITLEKTLISFYASHIFPHPRKEDIDFSLLVAVWLRGDTHLLVSEETVVNVAHDYECIGTGSYLAKYLIRPFWTATSRFITEALTLEEAGLIAAYALKNAMEYDQFCGGEAEFLILKRNGEVGDSFNAQLYPSEEFPLEVQSAMWRMLRKLIRTGADFGGCLNDFAKEVQEAHDHRKYFYDSILEGLRKSTKPSTSETSESEPQ